jgi:hypothetical protein
MQTLPLTIMIANTIRSRTLSFISAHPYIWLWRFVAEHAVTRAVCPYGGGGPVMCVENACPPHQIYYIIYRKCIEQARDLKKKYIFVTVKTDQQTLRF